MKGHSNHSDYAVIRQENERKYGTDIGRIGKMLLADRYADRTHFIFELLQNAEDALAKRSRNDQEVPSSIKFEISENSLMVSHYGKPFDEDDVKGICGIAESTKNELTAIGRFGIGFKSVYSFTDLPAIHSGCEHFAIENYVLPKEIPAIELKENETKIILPLNEEKNSKYYDEILEGIKRINLNSLLFLHYIEEIKWRTAKGENGAFIRSKPEKLDINVRKVELAGETNTSNSASEKWLIFSKELSDENNKGFVEIAFLMNGEHIQCVAHSPLVVFFPTEKQTNLGFLVQGPYRTTPSRDNIPLKNTWIRNVLIQQANLSLKRYTGYAIIIYLILRVYGVFP
jgi:HSP90 family molecular chaperone